MRIVRFKIEHYRNLVLAECDNLPQFVVICGGNGSGKSALLEALITAKEHAGAYGSFQFDPRAVSVDAKMARIELRVSFSEDERAWVEGRLQAPCPKEDEVVVEIDSGGRGRAVKRSQAVKTLFGFYSRVAGSPGFFDYITAHRVMEKQNLNTWDSSFLSDETAKSTLGGRQQFNNTKKFLAGLKMSDLQEIQTRVLQGQSLEPLPDRLATIRAFFDRFFAPMSFGDVYMDRSPFAFTVKTPRGDIDIDDMSSGEKEVLNVFVRFQQLNPHNAVILFDEADAHLHPDLERRYLYELRTLGGDNQLILTTHSPEMMIAAGSESLYAMLKDPGDGSNQFVRVSGTEQLHGVLADLMGSRGLISFNQRIVFIEGQNASADRAIYEKWYPPAAHNVSFVPAGNSATVRKTAEQVNALLSASTGFQSYFSIVDGDIDRAIAAPPNNRLFQLPVYHVENYLLDEDLLFSVVASLTGAKNPFASVKDLETALRAACVADGHIKPYARALLDARIAAVAKSAADAVFKGVPHVANVPAFPDVEAEAQTMVATSLADGTWKSKVKGRDVLRTFFRDLSLDYQAARNLMIERLSVAPPEVAQAFESILKP